MPDRSRTNVSRETLVRLELFETVLRRWNRTINLVGTRELDVLWSRHIDDSLDLMPFLPPDGRLTDMGSGAGFPGLVLAVATGRPTTLIEADQRKAAFLREAAREVAADVDVVPDRVESCGLTGRPIITARALAPLPRLLALAAPLLAPSGVGLFIKGPNVEAELTEAKREWQMSAVCHHGRGSNGSVVLEVRDLHPIELGPV